MFMKEARKQLNLHYRQTARTMLGVLLCIGCFLPGLAQHREVSSSPQISYLKVIRLIGEQAYEEALAEARRMVEANLWPEKASEKIVETAAAIGKPEQAESIFKSLLQAPSAALYAHYGLALLAQQKGRYAEAIEQYRKYLDGNGFSLTATWKLIEAYCQSGQETEAKSFAESLTMNSRNQPAGYLALGYYFAFVGQLEAAIKSYDEALRLGASVSEVCYQKATVLARAQRYRESLAICEECRALANASFEHDRTLLFLRMLASNYLVVGKRAEAKQIIEKIGQIQRETGDALAAEMVHTLTGIFFHSQAAYSQALSSYLQAERIVRQQNRLAEAGRLLGNIGSVYQKLGDATKAIDYYEQASLSSREANDPDNYASLLFRLGKLYTEQGKLDAAIEKYQILIKLGESPQNRKRLFLAIQAKAIVHLKANDFANAESELTKALKLARETGAYENELLGLLRLGELRLRTGNPAEAIPHFRALLQLSLGKGYLRYDWEAYAGLASAHEKLGKYEQAIESYQEAVKAIEIVRTTVDAENDQTGYFQSKVAVYQALVLVLMKLHKTTGESRYAAEAFHYAESARARTLLDRLSDSRTFLQSSLTPELRVLLSEIQKRLSRAEANLQEALATSRTAPNMIKPLEEQVHLALEDFRRWQETLRRRNPHYANLYYPEPLTVEQVQQMLKGN